MQQSKLDNYNSTRGASAYKGDYETKLHRKVSDRIERAIFARIFAALPAMRSALDLPCGAGRLYELLQANVPRVIEADWSFTMVALDRDDHGARAAGYLRASALAIPLPDRAVDLVVSVRLSHLLESEAERERHIGEICRVARRAAVVSYFSHWSLKNWLRRLRAPFNRKAPKHTLRSARVREVAGQHGFDLALALPLSRLGSGHVFALLTRAAP